MVVKDDGKVGFQGWAIVDNTSGEDWEAVRVGVGSSSALSFRYDLRSVQTVHRETLGGEVRFAHAPPGGMGIASPKRASQVTLAQLEDDLIPTPEGHPDAAYGFTHGKMSTAMSGGVADLGGGSGGGGFGAPSPPPAALQRSRRSRARAQARVATLAKEIKRLDKQVVLAGYANKNEEDAEERSLDRANRLRNELIAQGVAPSKLQVVGHGHVGGRKGGVELNVHSAGSGQTEASAPDEPVGESHFESTSPMTIQRGTSAMVSMVNTETPGEVVYLYAPDAARGHERFAFRAVRFHNPTDSSLEPGPVTVYGEGRFVGEGLAEAVPPGATSLVPFA
ncbi:MAG: OmpA family protein, partial [Myxococcota bacterium]|nr:OmpA family protein [Myxococcota bacterium]